MKDKQPSQKLTSDEDIHVHVMFCNEDIHVTSDNNYMY